MSTTTCSAARTVPMPVADGERLRFIAARIVRGPGGMSRAEVEFERASGTRFIGRQEGTTCPGGDLRLAALATFAVLAEAVAHAATFDLIGAKAVRAFDTTVIMVAAQLRLDGDTTRVVGAAIVGDTEVEATVRASLHAVNRLVSPMLGPLPVDG